MKRVILHIGTFKTGSTALQFHMHQNRKLLIKNGFYYGDYFDNYYLHSNLCYGLLREALTAHGVFEKYKSHPRFLNVAEEPNAVIGRMKENASNCRNIIISCEAFFADAFRTLVGLRTEIMDKEKKSINRFMRERLRELLSEFSEEVLIVCYLRRQDLLIESQYNQYCKNIWYGDENYILPTFMEFVALKPIELNYFSELEEWHEIFDNAVFIIRPYEKGETGYNSITDFYKNVLKIDDEEMKKFEYIEEMKMNLRLDRNVLEYKRHLGVYDRYISQLLKEYSGQLDVTRDYAYFKEEERKKFMDQFVQSNRRVAKKYLGREYLFADTQDVFSEYQGLEEEKIFEITRWLIDKLNVVVEG